MKEEHFRNKAVIIEANEERRIDRMLEFLPADVRYLLVKSPDDVSKLVSFIDGKVLPYANVVRDMLKTRIMVLDEVLTDI